MKRNRLAVLAILGFLGLWPAGQARAQYGYSRPQTNSGNQPAVSPYLNLTRPGNPAVNYSALVQPQINTNRALNQLQTQVNVDQQILMGELKQAPDGFNPSAFLPNTGHPTVFMNYGHFQGNGQYFNTARPGSTQAPGTRR